MKFRKPDKKIVMLFIVMFGSSIGMRTVYKKVSSIQSYRFCIDQQVSVLVQQRMKDFIADEQTNKFPFRCLAQAVHEEFPCVESVTVHRRVPGCLDVKITVSSPTIILNNNSLLLANGVIVSKDIFAKTASKKLHNVDVPSLQSIEDKALFIKRHLAQLSDAIFKMYRVELRDNFHALLHDKKQNKFSVLFNKDVELSEKKLAQCKRLKQRLEDRDVFISQPRERWVVDIRFKDQIVLYARKGDCYHG